MGCFQRTIKKKELPPSLQRDHQVSGTSRGEWKQVLLFSHANYPHQRGLPILNAGLFGRKRQILSFEKPSNSRTGNDGSMGLGEYSPATCENRCFELHHPDEASF